MSTMLDSACATSSSTAKVSSVLLPCTCCPMTAKNTCAATVGSAMYWRSLEYDSKDPPFPPSAWSASRGRRSRFCVPRRKNVTGRSPGAISLGLDQQLFPCANVFQDRHQRLGIEGLHEVVIEAVHLGKHLVSPLREFATHGDKQGLLTRQARTYLLRDLPATLAGQTDVQDHDIWRELAGTGEHFVAVVAARQARRFMAVRAQQFDRR